MNTVESRVKHIAESPITAEWQRDFWDHTVLRLDLPESCYFSYNFFIADNDPRIEVGMLEVKHEELWGNGIGERLVRSLGALAHKYGYPKLDTALNSQYSLDIFNRLFGEDRMSFRSISSTEPVKASVPSSYLEARRLLVEFEQFEVDLHNRDRGINTDVNLVGLDMSGWELPVENIEEVLGLVEQVDLTKTRT
jgi:hypothetical protein